jgi:LmbE family N-acetylglucosaminyl deacetylase
MLKILTKIKAALFRSVRRFYLGRRIRGVMQFLHGVEVKQGLSLTGLTNALVLVPHPDDESIGCGGTLLALTRAGVVCDAVFMTCGELSYVPLPGEAFDRSIAIASKKRRAAEAAQILGLNSMTFLEAEDGLLHESPEHVQTLVEKIKSTGCQRILCPWVHDAHPDHAVTFRMLQLALRQIKNDVEIWLYEVWSPLIANHVVPIDDTIEEKIKAVSLYQDSHERVEYASRFLGLAKYRSLLARQATYAEAFLVLDKQMFKSLDFPAPSFMPAVEISRRFIPSNPISAHSYSSSLRT